MLKKLTAERSQKTAVDLAQELSNPVERELVKFHIENTIRPSGDAATDLKNARLLANSVRNQQILSEVTRKPTAQSHSGASSAPPTQKDSNTIELSKEEMMIKQWGGLTDDDVKRVVNRS
jgi:dTDP-4-amino-4,6-dideoxygalactose transaminase